MPRRSRVGKKDIALLKYDQMFNLEANIIFRQRLHRREIRTPQRLELELGVHGPGVYLVKVLDESGRILGVEKVVKR